jgi:hypothetical protein
MEILNIAHSTSASNQSNRQAKVWRHEQLTQVTEIDRSGQELRQEVSKNVDAYFDS